MSKKLLGRVLPIPSISLLMKEAMFKIFQRHYENVSWTQYLSDMSRKHYILLLEYENTILGFSTQQIIVTNFQEKPIRILFSGDTIIDKEFWGEQELVRIWCTFAGQVLGQNLQTPLYWYLLSKGYRTYLYLPIFFKEFYPHYQKKTPAFFKQLMDFVSFFLYPNHYRPELGILAFEHSPGNLNAELSLIPASKQNHPQVQFFLKENPNFALGTELVCMAPISVQNMRSFAASYVAKGLEIPLPLP
ncbi:MAG: hypothetical protein AABZ60_25210 [Planctomycetota bacterium]